MKRKEFAINSFVTSEDIKSVRKKLGLSQADFAVLTNVSKKTIERWETTKDEITGPITTLIKVLREYPQIYDGLQIEDSKYPLRLIYMCLNEICTIIDVDEKDRRVSIRNYTNDLQRRAFGKIENPTFEEYEEFLESRCFPKTRDKIKLELERLDLPFYDPFLIIQKTQGRMAEDNFWIKVVFK